VLPGTVARDADAAVAAAQEHGYPVALKAADPALVHKSDIGAVRLNLHDPHAVREAYHAIEAALGANPPVLVQTMASAPVELVAGVVHDPLFGSLVMLGLGGVHTELLGDRALQLLPVTDLDAARMWRSPRAAPLLTGYRGAPGVDTAAVEDLLLRLGRLAEDFPEIAELDLNPIAAGQRAPVGAAQRHRTLLPHGRRLGRAEAGHRQPRDQVRIRRIGKADDIDDGPHAGQRGERVVQRRAACDRHLPVVGIDAPVTADPVDPQLRDVVTEPPAPRLAVDDRRRPRCRHRGARERSSCRQFAEDPRAPDELYCGHGYLQSLLRPLSAALGVRRQGR
jgi:ATP-grasp domain